MANMQLSNVECRVLGALVEKDITTPEYYPLSLNALVNACNQKSNRDPVMNVSEDEVRGALSSLAEKRVAGPTSSAESRVTKYEHRLQEVFNFTRRETAIVCVLLLRGPQTPGELRGRTERMHHFEDLSEVQSTLQKLMQYDAPLVRVLPRQPGTKEARYVHLFSGDEDYFETTRPTESPQGKDDDRMLRLEDEIAALRQELSDLKQQLAEMKKAFE
jgi:uncharacterized protein YceH (UPF0502 family)